MGEYSTSNKADTATCNGTISMPTTATSTIGAVVQFYGMFTTSAAGTAQVRWAQNTVSTTPTIIRANSYLVAYKVK